MKKESNNETMSNPKDLKEEKISLEGYPSFPAKDDIYNEYHKENIVDIDETSKGNRDVGTLENPNEFGFQDIISDSDLDIPGSELDNQQEEIGSEDEENNYYSIGGDNHDNLEEDKGD